MTAQDALTPLALSVLELIGRAGAVQFQVGHLDDTPLAEDARWWASAQWQGRRLMAEEHRSPTAAIVDLGRTLLDGDDVDGNRLGCLCARCGHRIWPVELLEPRTPLPTDRLCRWHLEGNTWRRGCDGQLGGARTTPNRAARRAARRNGHRRG